MAKSRNVSDVNAAIRLIIVRRKRINELSTLDVLTDMLAVKLTYGI